MDNYTLNGLDYITLVEYGAKNLASDFERINSLNVFPVPDGDTGTNMKMTIEGGAKEGLAQQIAHIGDLSKAMARAMVLSARGNSGVILSQFFKGMSMYLDGHETVNVREFAEALNSGTKRSYSVVTNPTEGTILTVMREAGENSYNKLNDNMSLEDYLVLYINEAKISLEKTPDLLPVLKKAGVIDSGGAGFILVMEGMLKAIRGEDVDSTNSDLNGKSVNIASFNADSELTYGYCTEFILQLQNSKVNTKEFDLNIITDFLKTLGNSIVSFKDEDLVKVHVHTFDPGIVLTEMRKYGELVTIKIENMNVQHSESNEIVASSQEPVEKCHKEYALVAVANGTGLVKAFQEMGVDEVVTGGQTMNTSTQDFIEAFDKLDADKIFVYPNNGNIMMAAKQAAENYDKCKVYVVPTKTIAEGYSAISMLQVEGCEPEDLVEAQKEVIANVSTLEVTYSVRDCVLNDIEVTKGDFICIYNNELISCNPSRIEAVKSAFKAISDFEDKQVLTVLCGQDVSIEEFSEIQEFAQTLNSYIEVYPIEGDQDIYSYIIGIE